MATFIRVPWLAATTVAAALFVAQPAQAATAAVQGQQIIFDHAPSKLVEDVGRRGGYRSGYRRGGYGYRRGFYGHRGYGYRRGYYRHAYRPYRRFYGGGYPAYGYGYGYPCGYGYGYGYGCPNYGYGYGAPVITFGFGAVGPW